jgi:pilus assembly protein CpaF
MFGKKSTSSDGNNGSVSPEKNALVGGDTHLPAVIPTIDVGGEIVQRQSSALYSGQNNVAGGGVASSYISSAPEKINFVDRNQETPKFLEVKMSLINDLVDKIDFAVMYQMSEERRKQRINVELAKLLANIEAPLTANQMVILKEQVVDEVLGFGPLEPLLRDHDVSDIMINTAKQVYIERHGKIYLTDVVFMNEAHLMAIIQRIVTRVGRRIDEASPMVDARLPDGSRFNAIIPPLALDGALVSIRKFKEAKISLKDYVNYGSMTPQMSKFLEICGNIRLNIIVSGGTGSGKTTMLNAISKHIDAGERVITIEDAAELQLMQPHVLRLETRPASSEGVGEVTQRQLVRNALRMRPDRIILGEIRGDEVIDVLTAMNTGHDGSLATIHSNSPRDCLARIENLVNMSGVKVSDSSLRYQISSALHLIVQLQRMRDGKRRVTHIEEVVGREGDTIVTQTLFSYHASGIDSVGNLVGEFRSSGIRPKFLPKAEYFARDKELLDALELSGQR